MVDSQSAPALGKSEISSKQPVPRQNSSTELRCGAAETSHSAEDSKSPAPGAAETPSEGEVCSSSPGNGTDSLPSHCGSGHGVPSKEANADSVVIGRRKSQDSLKSSKQSAHTSEKNLVENE